MTSKEEGGLGGSFFALNPPLVFKWRWRYFHCLESLWVKVVNYIHGLTSVLLGLQFLLLFSTWVGVLKVVDQLTARGLDLMTLHPARVRDGKTFRFWLYVWSGDNPLASTLHRIFALGSQIRCRCFYFLPSQIT